MGNKVTTTLDKWGINPRKLSLKRSTRKDKKSAPPAPSHHQTIEPHIYDNVSAEPKYAVVNKNKRTTDSDGLHYAEIQVLQSEVVSSQRSAPPKDSNTEYATIDFLRGAKPKEYDEPADILIPPGQLPNLMAKSQKKKSASSYQGSRGLNH